jgi:hypothetical protein
MYRMAMSQFGEIMADLKDLGYTKKFETAQHKYSKIIMA